MPFSGDRLRAARLRANHSTTSLGAEIGRSASIVVRYESGHVRPSLTSLERLAAALGCPPGELFADDLPAGRPGDAS